MPSLAMTTEWDPAPVPRPAPPGCRYAGPWIRLLALFLDSLLLYAIIFVMSLVLTGLLFMAFPQVSESLLINLDSGPAGPIAYVVICAVMLAWYGGWQHGAGGTPAMLALKLRVRDPSGEENPSLRAAVIRNSPQVLVGFGELTGNEIVDLLLGVFGVAVWAAIGITISESPERQGFHDRLAGGTYVVRRGS